MSDVQPAVATPEPAPLASTKTPHRLRFVLIYGSLAGVVAAAIVGVVLLAGTHGKHGGRPWSTWKPTAAGAAAVNQIVTHVSSRYRLGDGHQLLDVIAKSADVPTTTGSVPIGAVAIRRAGGTTDVVARIDSTNSLMFVLCGLGPRCSIASGAPSVARGRLVRREALELALYTFKYVDGVNYIVTLIPSPPTTKTEYALYFTRSDVDRQLQRPLVETIPLTKASTIPPLKPARIDQLTRDHTYAFNVTQTQQGDLVAILAGI